MNYNPNDWVGQWENFELYISSSDPYLQTAWNEAEAAGAALPMFQHGVKSFWKAACATATPANPHTLGGWKIEPETENRLKIAWLAEDGSVLGSAVYHLKTVLEKGLEGKENAVFEAENVPKEAGAEWPFGYLLSMEPMPARSARQSGGLLSHLHFQYGSSFEQLIDPETQTLRNPRWYATMCDGDGTILEKCNIVRALHRLPKWTQLSEVDK